MDILAAIAEQSPAVSLALVALYFLNKASIDTLRERKEIIDTLNAERNEWVEDSRVMTREVIALMRVSIESTQQLIAAVNEQRNCLEILTRQSRTQDADR